MLTNFANSTDVKHNVKQHQHDQHQQQEIYYSNNKDSLKSFKMSTTTCCPVDCLCNSDESVSIWWFEEKLVAVVFWLFLSSNNVGDIIKDIMVHCGVLQH